MASWLPRKTLTLMGCVFLTACGWSDMEGWSSSAVWSEDGNAALGVYRFYEGKDTVTHVKIRNMESEIFVFDDIGSGAEPRSILPRGRGWARPIYLMRGQGYAIVHRQEKLPELDDGMNKTANYTAYKVELDGRATSLGQRRFLSMISCDAAGQSAVTTGDVLTVIPSPDGRILAKLEMSATCQGKTGQLTFLDADTLSVLDGPIDLEPVADVNMIMNRAWHEDGRFMIAQTGFLGPQGLSYAPDTDPQETGDIDYSCYYPETSSGWVDDQGRSLEIADGALAVLDATPDAQVFGCD